MHAEGPDIDCTKPMGGCQIGDLFRLLGKSHVLTLLHLFCVTEDSPPRRFVEIQNALGISPNTLTERLKELVGAGLLERTAYNEIPPRVDYAATPKARDLRRVFQALDSWANAHTLEASSESAATA